MFLFLNLIKLGLKTFYRNSIYIILTMFQSQFFETQHSCKEHQLMLYLEYPKNVDFSIKVQTPSYLSLM